jgi:activator of HSP90 ATPase
MKTLMQKVEFKASPHEVYEALMDQKKHAKFTGSPARISREEGGRFEVYEGGLLGENVTLVKDKKIVQKWRCVMEGWPEDHYSTLEFVLKKSKTGTTLQMAHKGVPDGCADDISEGWEDFYWKPMKKMFGGK